MSDDCTNASANDKDMEFRSNKGKGMTSHYQNQCISTQVSYDSASGGYETSNFHNAKGKDACKSEHEYLLVGNNKSTNTKMASLGVNHVGTSEFEKICRSNLSKLEFEVDDHHSVGTVGVEKEKYKVDKTSDTEATASDTQSLSELPGASFHCNGHEACCSLHSEDASSEWNGFPLYGINQRGQGILHSKKTQAYDQRSAAFSPQLPARDATFDTQIVKFTAEEHRLETVELAEKTARETKSVKFVKSIPKCVFDSKGSMIHIFADRFKVCKTSVGLATRGKEKMEYSDSDDLFHGHSLKDGLANMSHGLCKYSGRSSWKLCEVDGDNDLAGNEVKRSVMKKRSIELQRNCVSGDLALSYLGRNIDGTLPTDLESRRQPFYKPFQGLTRLNLPASALHIFDEEPNQSIHGTETKMKDATKFSPKEKTITDLTVLNRSKGTAFFEMLTVPKSNAKGYDYSQTSCTDSGTKFPTQTTGFCDSPTRTETMSLDSCKMPKCQRVTISSSLNKDHLSHNPANSNSVSASPIKPYPDPVAKLQDGSENKKDTCASINESMNLAQVPSHAKRPHASNSTSATTSSWLKRLNPNTSDRGIKRLKVGDALPIEKPHQLFANLGKPYTSSSSKKHCYKEQIIDTTKAVKSSLDTTPGVSDKEIKTWIGRWLKKNPQTTQSQVMEAASGIHRTETAERLPEHYEGRRFPSIAALALMGKAMNSLRTRQFQRRGSSLVWNTEGLL